jgi:CHAT domain-containing protein
MRAIEKRFPRRTVLEGAKATPAAYKSAAPEKFDFVHFVAHGVATRKRPSTPRSSSRAMRRRATSSSRAT